MKTGLESGKKALYKYFWIYDIDDIGMVEISEKYGRFVEYTNEDFFKKGEKLPVNKRQLATAERRLLPFVSEDVLYIASYFMPACDYNELVITASKFKDDFIDFNLFIAFFKRIRNAILGKEDDSESNDKVIVHYFTDKMDLYVTNIDKKHSNNCTVFAVSKDHPEKNGWYQAYFNSLFDLKSLRLEVEDFGQPMKTLEDVLSINHPECLDSFGNITA